MRFRRTALSHASDTTTTILIPNAARPPFVIRHHVMDTSDRLSESSGSGNDDAVTDFLLASEKRTRSRTRINNCFRRNRVAIIIVVILASVIALFVALSWGLYVSYRDADETPPPSPSIEHLFSKAAVVSDALPCSEIGRDILKKGGNAVDATIATMFCVGVIQSQSMGLGGGFLMVIYLNDTKTAYALDARETAPGLAYENMYHENPKLSRIGKLSIAVPGELKGYWEAHRRFGKISWSTLVEPTIELCRNGFKVTPHAANALKVMEKEILLQPTLSPIFVNKTTGSVYVEGDTMYRRDLVDALQTIADKGGDTLYNGSLSDALFEDLQDIGSIITKEDLANYKVNWREPVTAKLHGNMTLYTSPLSGSGAIMAFIFNILHGYGMNPTDMDNNEDAILSYHRIVEAFKFAYAKRTELGDDAYVDVADLLANLTSPAYGEAIRGRIVDDHTFSDPTHYDAKLSAQPKDFGTSHIAVIGPNGDAVSATSTVNLYFGSLMRSRRTGIILNDEMDDFSSPNITNFFGLPPFSANYIKPGKRPLSSMCPAIFVDGKGEARLVIGAAGGSKITSTTAFSAMRYLWFNDTLKQAVDARRLHHQLFPMIIQYEVGFKNSYLKGLEKLGHDTTPFDAWASVINAASKEKRGIYANADFRKGGDAAGF